MGKQASAIHPVVLSGGNGTRLWPLSRATLPKQLLPLAGEHTMLQETVLRTSGPGFAAPLVVCNEDHRFLVAEQMRALGVTPKGILLEPVGRNTAPAAAMAALALAERDAEAVMLLLPSDHVVAKPEVFRAAVETAAAAARDGALVAFGIAPDHPATGYGYIRRGVPAPGPAGCWRIERFVEKPDLATATRFVDSGDYSWNSGMFVFTAETFLRELERFAPEVLSACRAAHAGVAGDLDFRRIPQAAFAAAPSISIDYAVMEKTDRAVVVPVEIGWNDVGAWSALWDIAAKDENGNSLTGDVLALDTHGSYLRSDGPLVAAVGVEEMVVVATADAVLVARKDQVQDVKKVVEELSRQGRDQHINHIQVFRPWGSYQSIDRGERFQVKRIVVQPGAKLSLQMHHHRAEHWVVVQGTAKVTRGEETLLVFENESTFIPMGVKHRLENPGKVPLHLIEVQSGTYLGEDDIIRFDDTYGRN